MNWIFFWPLTMAATGGIIAALYKNIARRYDLPVGTLFGENGVMTVTGSLVTVGVILITYLLNPKWAIIAMCLVAWLLTEIIIKSFGKNAPLVSFLFIFAGLVVFLFLYLK